MRDGESDMGKERKPVRRRVCYQGDLWEMGPGSPCEILRRLPRLVCLEQGGRCIYPWAPTPTAAGLPQENELLPYLAQALLWTQQVPALWESCGAGTRETAVRLALTQLWLKAEWPRGMGQAAETPL